MCCCGCLSNQALCIHLILRTFNSEGLVFSTHCYCLSRFTIQQPVDVFVNETHSGSTDRRLPASELVLCWYIMLPFHKKKNRQHIFSSSTEMKLMKILTLKDKRRTVSSVGPSKKRFTSFG